jgi:hypothetical protein
MNIQKMVLIAAIALAGTAQAQPAAETALNGQWQISLSVMGNDASTTCNLTTESKVIKGNCGTWGNAAGTIDGTKVVLKTDGGESPLVFTGVLKEGVLKGTVDVSSYNVQGEFEGHASK